MTADEVKVMKRIHTLTQHKDLIRDILKIEVSENNPLTTEKFFRRVTEWTNIEAEISNHSNNYEEAYFAKRQSRWNQNKNVTPDRFFTVNAAIDSYREAIENYAINASRKGPQGMSTAHSVKY